MADSVVVVQKHVVIREAREGDFNFVARIMEEALPEWYNGDHGAHATRIYDAHMAGGTDNVGHFSAEQHMFIIEVNGWRARMVHLVVKKQRTTKISPLIVAKEFQGVGGLGSKLLAHAEAFAREHGSRQIYATVAESNGKAYGFFRHMGYSVAGKSPSHYKPGSTEVMIYKPLDDVKAIEERDRQHISVREFDEEQHGEQVRALILEKLAPQFDGVDDSWIDALYAGYRRRHTREVNAKFKLVYVAVDSDGVVLGVVGCTPKKGEPIKLMPCVAKTPEAFAALLIDIPYMLRAFGRKLYVHCVPSVPEVMVLQRLGWLQNAQMPAAYHIKFSTQQWSNDLEITMNRNIRVKGHLLRQIKRGDKTLEVRAGYPNIKEIKQGDTIHFMSSDEECDVRVKGVRVFPNIDAMMGKEDHTRIAADMSRQGVVDLLHSIYPPAKERLGIYVFEIEVVRGARG